MFGLNNSMIMEVMPSLNDEEHSQQEDLRIHPLCP